MDPNKKKHIFKLGYAGLGIIVLCLILVHFGRIWILKVWGDLRFVNYFVAFIPTLFSILFAFIVDKDLEIHFRKLWRLGIVACGILYSVALWHQQKLTDQDNLNTQQKIVNDAVSKANAHSDQQFAGVQQNVGALGGQVTGLSQSLNATTSTISSALEKSTSQLNDSIGKVTQPEPIKPAVLIFSLWDMAATLDKPVVSKFIQPDNDGNYSIDFSFTNVSESTADAIDVWIQVCDGCSFAKEPAGFEKVAGSDDRVRHRIINSLNPGVSFEKTTIVVKSVPTEGSFRIGFRYSCKTCGGKMEPTQLATIWKGYFPRLPASKSNPTIAPQ
jgi:hypothetical protein